MFVSPKPKRNKTKAASSQTGPIALKISQPVPSHEQISLRAYEIYQSGGYADGRDQHDWYRAELEMFALRK